MARVKDHIYHDETCLLQRWQSAHKANCSQEDYIPITKRHYGLKLFLSAYK